jgi:amino acid adenylation domain-containing protein
MDNLTRRIAELSPAKRALLELRLKQGTAQAERAQVIKQRDNRDRAEVSFAQQRLWFLDQLESNRALYNVPRALRLSGPLDITALERTMNELVARHEPFRTCFESRDGRLQQVILEKVEIGLDVIDLSARSPALSMTEIEAEAQRLAQQEATRPFDLALGPVVRAGLLRLAEQEHVLLLTTHHIVSDAWSADILFRELGALYNAFASGQSSPLTPLAIQYADFAEWQRQWLQGDELERQVSYWRGQLAGASGVLELPTDQPRSAHRESLGAYQSLRLSTSLSRELSELSKRSGATVFMTLLAAFQILLWRYSGQDDIIVGSPIAGRNRAEIENLIGFFINSLALRADLSGDPTFVELLSQVRETALGAYAHQDLPFEKLVEELHPERDPGRNPLFQVMFQMQNSARAELHLKDLTVKALDVSTGTAKFDLMLAIREDNGELLCVMEYSSELFTGDTVARMLHQYQILLQAIVNDPAQRIASVPLMTDGERHQVVLKWNATQTEFPAASSTIHHLFERQAEQTPDKVAVVDADETITFSDLNARANQLAHYLKKCGVGPEECVAICLERSVDMIAGLLGILKAGAAYVPLEPNYPADRTSFILADSGATLLLTQKSLRDALPQSATRLLCIDELGAELLLESTANLNSEVTLENAAHVIYTSGSTGRPKGVMSSHSASVNRFQWMWRQYPFADGEVCCQKTSLSFVDSIWEIFGPLLRGVPLVIIPDDTVKDPQRFVATLAAQKVTRLVLVPSLLRAISESVADFARQLGDLRYCVCSGETLPVELADEFLNKLPQTKLINLYGSSEVAADVTCYELTDKAALSTVPIGRPIANTQVYVLDSEMQPAAIGVPGEVFVGGAGLARGYLDRPDLTAEKFVPDPFSSSGGRLFRSGDMGRLREDGNIEYRGRRDHQVKVRGFRIELGEVEAALLAHSKISEAVVVTREAEHGEKRLVGYFVGEDGTALTPADLRNHLRQTLPDYMVPSAFVRLAALPLTASGKINRLALPEPGHVAATDDFLAPRTPTEEVLASIWSDVLKLEKVSVSDDFFALGGHSLLLARVLARIQDAFEIELPLRKLFTATTVSSLAEAIEIARRSSSGAPELPLLVTPRRGALPLSFAQERLWFFDQLEPGSAAYNIPRALRLQGPLDREALRQSLEATVLRHEVLRSTFQNHDGRPQLMLAAPQSSEVSLHDIRDLSPAERDTRAKELVAEEIQRPFDLGRAPLLRLTLVRVADDEHLLVLTMHHIISDGWSIGIFLRELVAHYNATVTGSDAALPELKIQYVDYSAWQREHLSGPALEKQMEFWRAQLGSAPPLINLPIDRPRPDARSFLGARQSLRFSKETTRGLKEIGRSERTTLFMTLLSTFQLLLSCVADEDDIVLGSPIAGRNQPEIENLIGYFVNTLVLRTKFDGAESFPTLLRRVRETTLGAYANQEVPFEKLVDEFCPQRSLKFNPLFQVWFVLQNAAVERQEWQGLTAQPLELDSVSTRHDLQLTLWEDAATIEGAFTYSRDLFDDDTIACFSEQFRFLLETLVAQPDIVLSELREQVVAAGRIYRQQRAEQLEAQSRTKLKAVKRRVVTAEADAQ